MVTLYTRKFLGYQHVYLMYEKTSREWQLTLSLRYNDAMSYLIDGHNLIPKLGLRLDSIDDEMELVSILQEFCRLQRRTAEVYFDGAPAGQSGTQKFGVVTTHFVRLGTTADNAIKARLGKLGRTARNWIVVSSDHEVQNSAKGAHANFISSDSFAGQLTCACGTGAGKQARAAAPKTKTEQNLSAEEVDEWIKFFNQKK